MTETSATPVSIELQGVTKRFGPRGAPSGPAAVDELDLEIRPGELLALVGPSGCGKTTTLRMINRLETPTSGRILLDGVDTASLSLTQLRRGIGYVIQDVGLFPHRTIAANIETVPKLLGWSAARRTRRVEELVELVDLDPGLLTRYPAELSGGQQQRVGVARALAADPGVLLMDEPYSAVDPIVRTRLQAELRRLHQRVGTTIVLVTHDIDEALGLADRVAILRTGGRLAQLATPRALLARPADGFVAAFLGADRTLRRLALTPLTELALGPVAHAAEGTSAPVIELSENGRAALDLLVSSGAPAITVLDNGRAIGSLDQTQLTASLRDPVT
jgi:osmoprotectant transport system ATP-binding protein